MKGSRAASLLFLETCPLPVEVVETEAKNLYRSQGIAESNAPGFHSGQNSLATIDVEISANASGVLYCVGGTAGGFSVYMDNGYLSAEYMSTLLQLSLYHKLHGSSR